MEKLTSGQSAFLDYYRICAALFVLFGHSFSYYKLTLFKNQAHFPYVQNIAVIMFFLLSGFLTMCSLCQKNKSGDYKLMDFLKHKVKRVFMEYFPALLFVALIDCIAIWLNGDKYPYYGAFNFKTFVGNLLMLQGTLVNKIPGIEIIPFGSCRPIWTLSLEWWFYFVMAILFFMVANKKVMNFTGFLFFMATVGICSEYLIGGRGNGLGFVFGLGALAYFVYEKVDYRASVLMGGTSCALYIFYGLRVKEAYTVYSFILLWFIFVSFLRMTMKFNLKDTSKYVSFFARSTFILYLIHYSIIDVIFRNSALGIGVRGKFVLGIGLSLLVSEVVYYLFGEKKLLLKCYNFMR